MPILVGPGHCPGNPPVEGIIIFLRSRRVYQVVETWQGVILTIQAFFKAENNIV